MSVFGTDQCSLVAYIILHEVGVDSAVCLLEVLVEQIFAEILIVAPRIWAFVGSDTLVAIEVVLEVTESPELLGTKLTFVRS